MLLKAKGDKTTNFFLVASFRVEIGECPSKFMYFRRLPYFVIASEKMFWLINPSSKPLNDMKFINIFHNYGPNFEIRLSLKFYYQGAAISEGHF